MYKLFQLSLLQFVTLVFKAHAVMYLYFVYTISQNTDGLWLPQLVKSQKSRGGSEGTPQACALLR